MSKTVEDIGTLKINLLSQAQYDAEKAGGRLADDELYLTPSSGTGVSDVEVNGESVVSGGVAEITVNDIPSGGTTGQVLTKDSGTDYDVSWEDPSGGTITDVTVDGTSIVDDGVAELETVTQLRDGLMTATDKQKLDGIASGAEVNVQSDWNQSTNTADDYIKNKPTIPTVNNATLTIQKNGTTVNTFTANASSNVTANISVPTQASDIGAQPTLVSGTNIKTVNGSSLLGSGNIKITDFFIAEYGVTLYSSILSAYTNGKNLLCDNGDGELMLFSSYDSESEQFAFDRILGVSWYQVICSKTNGWQNGYIILASNDTATEYSNGLLSSSDKTKLDGIASGAEVNVNADWSAVSGDAEILNKPTIPTNTSDLNNDSGFITGVTSTSTPTASTIAEFDNDAQLNSTDMTSQEIDDFVDSLNVTGINAVDYVVEQGTDNSWSYRKWNSGAYEAWRTYSGTTSLTTSSAGTYYGTQISISAPSFSISILNCQATPKSSLASGVFIYKFESVNSTTCGIDFRAHVSVASAAVSAYLHIQGTWK